MSSRRVTPLTRYRMFHGRNKCPWTTTPFHVPKNLIFLGQAISIVYLCNKKHGGGDGKLTEFEHEFETPVDLFMDERGAAQLYLVGRQLKVTENGIEN